MEKYQDTYDINYISPEKENYDNEHFPDLLL